MAGQAAVALLPRVKENRMLGIGDTQTGLMSAITQIATERCRSAASASRTDNPARLRVPLALHLTENGFGDIVVAAPISHPLGIAELIQVVAVAHRGDRKSTRLNSSH